MFCIKHFNYLSLSLSNSKHNFYQQYIAEHNATYFTHFLLISTYIRNIYISKRTFPTPSSVSTNA